MPDAGRTHARLQQKAQAAGTTGTPMAAVTAPAQVSAQHQKLLHFVANAPWSDEQMLAKVRELVMPSLTRAGPIEAWIIDDTSFPKKGRHSVGVHHQYCGQLGKQANCQVAAGLDIASDKAKFDLPVRSTSGVMRTWASNSGMPPWDPQRTSGKLCG